MIAVINLSDIEHLKAQAMKEGLVFCNSCVLYGLFKNGTLVGFTGIVKQKSKVIFKNHFVLLDQRGKGYFKELFDFSINYTKSFGIKKVEATCTQKSINHYLSNGFQVIKEYKYYKKVVNENI